MVFSPISRRFGEAKDSNMEFASSHDTAFKAFGKGRKLLENNQPRPAYIEFNAELPFCLFPILTSWCVGVVQIELSQLVLELFRKLGYPFAREIVSRRKRKLRNFR